MTALTTSIVPAGAGTPDRSPSVSRALSRSRRPGEDPAAEAARDFMTRAEGLLAKLTAENAALQARLIDAQEANRAATEAHAATVAALRETLAVKDAFIAENRASITTLEGRVTALEGTVAKHGIVCADATFLRQQFNQKWNQYKW